MQKNPTNNPIDVFKSWLEEAKNTSSIKEPTAMCVSTANKLGVPSSRMLLLKSVDDRGFVFYTNLTSKKGQDLAENQNVSLCFYWADLGKQVNIQGVAKPVSKKEADSYFASRDIRSRVGAWASKQSQKMAGRLELMKRVAEYTAKFGVKVPRPPHWSGFRIEPKQIELWEEGAFRLHKRKMYKKLGTDWQMDTLFP